MVEIVSWNVGQLDLLDEVEDADVVLLQECPPSVRTNPEWIVVPAGGEWSTGTSPWRTAIAVRRASGLTVEPIPLSSLDDAADGEVGVSRSGTLTAARISGEGTPPLVVVSAYARWEYAHGGSPIYADANAHRILSDLSVFLTHEKPRVDLVVAGDWNLLYGYNEAGWPKYWKRRYDTFFDRAEVLGLVYLGPDSRNSRQADPWPAELPADSRCVPTFYSNRQDPASATRQLDHVFATVGIADRIRVYALNAVEDWGRSDHCRILIECGAGSELTDE